jgi:drug/metabolite transporter (DMT)-like permease
VYLTIARRDQLNKQILKEASITGFFSVFLVSISFIYALQEISSGLVTLMISSAPIFTVIWLKILLKEERISSVKYFSVFIGFLGIVYLFLTQETGLENQGNILIGGPLAFLGVQCISLSTVLNRRFAPKYKVTSWLAYQYPFVVVLITATFFILGIEVQELSTSQIVRLAFLVFSNLGAFLTFTWLIQRVSALQVASIDYLVPVVGVTSGVIFLGESFNNNILVAGVFIFFSLIINTYEEFSR